MRMRAREALIRRAMLMLAMAGTVITVLSLVLPATFGVTAATSLALGIPVTATSWVVAWRAHRIADPRQLDGLAFVHVLLATGASASAVLLSSGHTLSIIMTLALVFVYSSMVLGGRRHAIVAALGMTIVVAGSLATNEVTPDVIAGLVVAAAIAVLSGVAAQLNEQQLADREDALRRAQRAARALEAAVTGIRQSTTIDSDRILEAITSSAGRLADGPAVLYALDDDGRLRMQASHGLGPDIEHRVFDPDEGLIGRVLRAGTTCTYAAEDDGPATEIQRALGVRRVIGTPIRVNGMVIGTLVAGRRDPETWSPEEIDAYTLLADHAGRALEMSREAAADRRAMARLTELDRIKDDVVATVSHELRTPVTVIAGLSETLAIRPGLTEEVREELIQRLWANGVSLAQIVEQLLDAALMQRGTLRPVHTVVPLASLVERTTTRLQPLLASHRISNEVDPSIAVDADPALLERVVENLLVNAVRHTPPETTVTIEALAVRDHEIHVSVADDGPGIPSTELARVLERFERGGDINERTRGMGIGLSLADEILRAHGSALRVSSHVGGGARFTFVLPPSSAPAARERGATTLRQ